MTSHQHHHQQNRQRERDRSQRERHGTGTGSSCGGPHSVPQSATLFSEPIKNRDEDETTKKIKSTLGDFDQVQRLLLNDHKPLIGISTREITRIRGNKARIEQILSEMRAFPPITGLDEVDDGHDDPVQRHAASHPAVGSDDLSMSGVSEDEDEPQKRLRPSPDVRHSPLRKGPVLVNGIVRKDSPVRRDRSSSSSASSSDSDSDSSSGSSSDEMSGNEGADRKSERETCSAGADVTAANVCWNLGSFVNKSSPKKHPKQQEKGAAIGRKDCRTEVTDGSKCEEKGSDEDEENTISQIIEQVATGQSHESAESSSSTSPSLSPASPVTASGGKRKHLGPEDGQKQVKHLKTSDDVRSGHEADVRSPVKTDKFLESESVRRNGGPVSTGNAITLSASNNSSGNKKSVCRPEERSREAKGLLPPAASSGSVRNEMPFVSTNHSIHGKAERNNSRINHKENFSGRVWPTTQPQIMCSISFDRLNRIPKACPTKAHCKEVTNFTADKSPGDRKAKSTPLSSGSTPSSSSKWKASESKAVLGLKDPHNSRVRQESTLNQSASISSYRKVPKSSSARVKSENCSPPPVKEETSTVSKTDHAIDVKTTNHQSRHVASAFPASSGCSQPENEGLSSDSCLLNAKKLKHAADKESDRTIQLCKYLEAVLFFILTGIAMERQNEPPDKLVLMYRDTLQLVKHVVPKFIKSRPPPHNNEIPTTDHKLMALCYRCQSLLTLRLSRLKSKEMRDLTKVIQTQAPDPSPTSASQSAPPVTLSAHLYACIRKQLNMYAEVTSAHDLWYQADYLIEKHSSCKAFFSALDGECRALSLNSSLDDLVAYVRTGLKILH